MKTVSLLCVLVRQIALIMVWIVGRVYNTVFPLVEWLWRRLSLTWRCLITTSAAVFGRTLLALGFRRSVPGSQGEPDTSDQNKLPETTSPPEPEEAESEGGYSEGLHEAEAGNGVVRQRSDYEEEEEDEGHEFDCEEYRVETTDEFYCDYDSTWETEEGPEGTSSSPPSRHYKFNRFRDAARDMQNYRHGYPLQIRPQRRNWTVSDDRPNLNFYLGMKPSSPDGVYISSFHNEWYGEYDTLEYVHTYIQWLFPLQEPGMNCDARTLTKAEIEDFLNNTIAKENLLTSYKLMLDFYGMKLCNEDTGDVRRALNWRDRFNNLNSHTHNNLRITRILKCLGTLGYSHYQAPLVRFFLEQTLVHGELPKVKDSILSYFVFAVLDKRQRRNLIKFAYLNYDNKDEFVWCPKKLQMKWSVSMSQKEMHSSNEAFVLNMGPVVKDLNLDRKDEDEASEAAKAAFGDNVESL